MPSLLGLNVLLPTCPPPPVMLRRHVISPGNNVSRVPTPPTLRGKSGCSFYFAHQRPYSHPSHRPLTSIPKALDIKIIRSKALRGQAFITLSSTAVATEVLSKLNGTSICDKELMISYAKEKSDVVAKRDGTFVPQEVREEREKKRKERQDKVTEERKRREDANADSEESAAKKAKTEDEGSSSSGNSSSSVPNPFTLDPSAPPSNLLLAPSLPSEVTPEMLTILFSQYHGFISARSPRAGVGIVEFSQEGEAGVALEALKGFKLTPTVGLELGYGKAE